MSAVVIIIQNNMFLLGLKNKNVHLFCHEDIFLLYQVTFSLLHLDSVYVFSEM